MNKTAYKSTNLLAGSVELTLPSRIEAVDTAVCIVCELVQSCCDGSMVKRLELALDEAIRNAYEHGSLGITKEEKEALCLSEQLEEELRRREPVALKKGKTIRVKAKLHDRHFTCSVEDDGPGFDWRKQLLVPLETNVDISRLNGRGLILIRQIFDTVSFNERGNLMTVTKQF